MALMPRGEPRSVPDPAGDAYDEWVRRKRAADAAEAAAASTPPPSAVPEPPKLSSWDGRTRKSRVGHPVQVNSIGDWVQDKYADFQDGPYIGHTSKADEFIPLYGPVRNGLAYLQDGDYGSAAVSGLQAGLDLASFIPGEAAVGIAAKALARGDALLPRVLTSHRATNYLYDVAKVAQRGVDEVHHVIPLRGMSRSQPAMRNHPAFLMPLEKEVHKRLHGSWMGKPRYGLLKRLDVGTPPWMKAVAAGATAEASRALPQEDPDD